MPYPGFEQDKADREKMMDGSGPFEDLEDEDITGGTPEVGDPTADDIMVGDLNPSDRDGDIDDADDIFVG